MNPISEKLAARLAALKAQGIIAGWQNGGGPTAGLSDRPLPALVFPADGTGAWTFWSERDLSDHVSVLETLGPVHRAPKRVR